MSLSNRKTNTAGKRHYRFVTQCYKNHMVGVHECNPSSRFMEAMLLFSKIPETRSTADQQDSKQIHETEGDYPSRSIFDILKEVGKERLAEDESDASDLNGELTVYSDHKPEIDVEENPAHEEDSGSRWDTNTYIIHPCSL
ncbi:hypothetical protein AVEN_123254-1 [Araneus ventricosus]|uniref:Uncharacterized protein n=1 Tax=Araneus ventricosus TaxID=182803 RepID=A0A4Y2W4F6_ARAVE|nr:hypothetical protein AVEN_173774-1 [Araneus ventricosus]GBO31761.1 hypothetical protein AVEN_123254-1 [Araneus ventricosus]